MTNEEAPDSTDLDAFVERLSYAPGSVDPEEVVAVLEASDPDDRVAIADAIGDLPPSKVATLDGAVPVLVETLDRDVGWDRRHLLEALAAIARERPAAVRPFADRLVEELEAFNFWIGSAATEVLRHVVDAYPEEMAAVEPLLGHDNRRVQARAAEVIAAATARRPTIERQVLADCVDLVDENAIARDAAIDVLASVGWIDPGALGPVAETLVEAARGDDPERRVAALAALSHVAGYDPDRVRSVLPLAADLSAADHEGVARTAAVLLVTVVLQTPETDDGVRALVDDEAYFERVGLLRTVAAVSEGLPGRELLLEDFLDDDSSQLRYELYRLWFPAAAGTGGG